MPSGASDSEEVPCQHCEQGIDKATPAASVAALLAPAFHIETVIVTKPTVLLLAQLSPLNSEMDRRTWLDPPPTPALTPISLKTRLLT